MHIIVPQPRAHRTRARRRPRTRRPRSHGASPSPARSIRRPVVASSRRPVPRHTTRGLRFHRTARRTGRRTGRESRFRTRTRPHDIPINPHGDSTRRPGSRGVGICKSIRCFIYIFKCVISILNAYCAFLNTTELHFCLGWATGLQILPQVVIYYVAYTGYWPLGSSVAQRRRGSKIRGLVLLAILRVKYVKCVPRACPRI